MENKMQNQFIKLELADGGSVYIRPQDIVALEWDDLDKTTTVVVLYGNQTETYETNLTPGFILDRCNKPGPHFNHKTNRDEW